MIEIGVVRREELESPGFTQGSKSFHLAMERVNSLNSLVNRLNKLALRAVENRISLLLRNLNVNMEFIA